MKLGRNLKGLIHGVALWFKWKIYLHNGWRTHPTRLTSCKRTYADYNNKINKTHP